MVNGIRSGAAWAVAFARAAVWLMGSPNLAGVL
jgi:hypothetical protein